MTRGIDGREAERLTGNSMDTPGIYVKQERNSNIEWLRIISMLLIIAFHAVRTVFDNTTDTTGIRFFREFACSWGILGVDLFVIIGSWFMAGKKLKVRKLISIVFQVFTYVVIYTAVLAVYEYRSAGSIGAAAVNIFRYELHALFDPLWSSCYWFATAYILLMLMSPVLNHILLGTSGKGLKKILILTAFIPVFSQYSTNHVTDIISFAYIYLLTGYLKLYGEGIIDKLAKPWIVIAVSCVFLISRLVLTAEYSSVAMRTIAVLLENTLAMPTRHSLIMLFDAYLVFFCVSKKPPRFNGKVNAVAGCTFGVYLFHENNISTLPNTLDTIIHTLQGRGLFTGGIKFAGEFFLMVLLVFIAGTMFEAVRKRALQKPFERHIDRKFAEKHLTADDWLNTVD